MSFTCNIRITCALCGFTVCGNPDHDGYTSEPHAAMRKHKATAHESLVSGPVDPTKEDKKP